MVAYHHLSSDRSAFQRETAETLKRSYVFESMMCAKFTSYAKPRMFSASRFTANIDECDAGFVCI